jgi:hypothetical protein
MTHFCKRSEGFAGPRMVVFHVKTKIVKGGPLASYGWSWTAPAKVSLHIRQGSGEAFQCLSACNWSNPQDHLGLQKLLRRWVRYELIDDQKRLKY